MNDLLVTVSIESPPKLLPQGLISVSAQVRISIEERSTIKNLPEKPTSQLTAFVHHCSSSVENVLVLTRLVVEGRKSDGEDILEQQRNCEDEVLDSYTHQLDSSVPWSILPSSDYITLASAVVLPVTRSALYLIVVPMNEHISSIEGLPSTLYSTSFSVHLRPVQWKETDCDEKIGGKSNPIGSDAGTDKAGRGEVGASLKEVEEDPKEGEVEEKKEKGDGNAEASEINIRGKGDLDRDAMKEKHQLRNQGQRGEQRQQRKRRENDITIPCLDSYRVSKGHVSPLLRTAVVVGWIPEKKHLLIWWTKALGREDLFLSHNIRLAKENIFYEPQGGKPQIYIVTQYCILNTPLGCTIEVHCGQILKRLSFCPESDLHGLLHYIEIDWMEAGMSQEIKLVFPDKDGYLFGKSCFNNSGLKAHFNRNNDAVGEMEIRDASSQNEDVSDDPTLNVVDVSSSKKCFAEFTTRDTSNRVAGIASALSTTTTTTAATYINTPRSLFINNTSTMCEGSAAQLREHTCEEVVFPLINLLLSVQENDLAEERQLFLDSGVTIDGPFCNVLLSSRPILQGHFYNHKVVIKSFLSGHECFSKLEHLMSKTKGYQAPNESMHKRYCYADIVTIQHSTSDFASKFGMGLKASTDNSACRKSYSNGKKKNSVMFSKMKGLQSPWLLVREMSPITLASWSVYISNKSDGHLMRYLLLDIASGVDYLHGLGIAHGRLHPGNILLFPHTGIAPFRAKVCDGLAFLTEIDLHYRAPELVRDSQPTIAGDCFALGRLWSLLRKEQIYYERMTYSDSISRMEADGLSEVRDSSMRHDIDLSPYYSGKMKSVNATLAPVLTPSFLSGNGSARDIQPATPMMAGRDDVVSSPNTSFYSNNNSDALSKTFEQRKDFRITYNSMCVEPMSMITKPVNLNFTHWATPPPSPIIYQGQGILSHSQYSELRPQYTSQVPPLYPQASAFEQVPPETPWQSLSIRSTPRTHSMPLHEQLSTSTTSAYFAIDTLPNHNTNANAGTSRSTTATTPDAQGLRTSISSTYSTNPIRGEDTLDSLAANHARFVGEAVTIKALTASETAARPSIATVMLKCWVFQVPSVILDRLCSLAAFAELESTSVSPKRRYEVNEGDLHRVRRARSDTKLDGFSEVAIDPVGGVGDGGDFNLGNRRIYEEKQLLQTGSYDFNRDSREHNHKKQHASVQGEEDKESGSYSRCASIEREETEHQEPVATGLRPGRATREQVQQVRSDINAISLCCENLSWLGVCSSISFRSTLDLLCSLVEIRAIALELSSKQRGMKQKIQEAYRNDGIEDCSTDAGDGTARTYIKPSFTLAQGSAISCLDCETIDGMLLMQLECLPSQSLVPALLDLTLKYSIE